MIIWMWSYYVGFHQFSTRLFQALDFRPVVLALLAGKLSCHYIFEDIRKVLDILNISYCILGGHEVNEYYLTNIVFYKAECVTEHIINECGSLMEKYLYIAV